MNCIYKSVLALGILGGSVPVMAQTETDALRFGQTSVTGTARSLAVGGAMGAVGGDMSASSINPASLGIYRTSEFIITPTLKFGNNSADYLNTNTSTGFSRFSINNFGAVFSTPARGADYEKKNWKSVAFGITFNKLQDFNEEGRYKGNNKESSITEVFAEDAARYGTSWQMAPPYGALAWEGFLIDENNHSYVYNDILLNGGSVNQEKSWRKRGNVQEWGLVFGGNYREKLMIGGSLNILSYRYNSTVNYYEEDASTNTGNNFDYLTYNEYLDTRGVGFNAKFGMLYNINTDVRVGGHISTPTWSAMNDEADYEIRTETEALSGTRVVRPDKPYYFEYSLRTPWKVGVNAMTYLGNKGFISADYEYIAYNTMSYSFPGFQSGADNVNRQIQNTFTGGHVIRVGAEGRFDNLFVRAGVAHHTSPFKESKTFGGARTDFSVGGGVNLQGFSINLAYVYALRSYSEYGYPIVYSGIPVGLGKINNNNNFIALSLGFKL